MQPPRSGPAARPAVHSPTLTGLSLLQAALDAAAKLNLNRWEFAVRLPALHAEGLNETMVRELVARGWAEHAHEQIRPGANRRSFRRIANLALTERSCFVLTPAGEALLEPFDASANGNGHAAGRLLPKWDGNRRRLWYDGQLVKCYRVPACCQEILLAAFEEDGWPPRIDDPLPRLRNLDPRERLHYAIRRLNGRQFSRRLAFRRDGTGQGVTWVGRAETVSGTISKTVPDTFPDALRSVGPIPPLMGGWIRSESRVGRWRA